MKLMTASAVLCLLATSVAFAASTDLPNFATVHPGLMRGAAPTTAGLVQLKNMGVNTIVDLRIGPKALVTTEKAQVEKLGMTFVNIPMGAAPPTSKQISRWLAIANAASPKGAVYVHCQHGADRTGEMVGIYRETHDGWSFDKTYAEMRHYGFKKFYTVLAANVKKYAKA